MSSPSAGRQARPVILAATASAAFAAQLARAGADAVVAYHSSTYRQRGLPSVAGLLPWDSANRQTLAALPGVVGGAGGTPVVATVCANDGLLPVPQMLRAVAAGGATGILNAPTMGLFTGPVREIVEEAGLGMAAEMRLVTQAREAGLDAWAYVFDRAWSEAALRAGASGLIVHLGITGYPLDPCSPPARLVREAIAPVVQSHRDLPVLLHGGALRTPADAATLLQDLDHVTRSRVSGFFGASAFEASGQDGPSAADRISRWRDALALRRTR